MVPLASEAATDLAVRKQGFGVVKLCVEENTVVDDLVRLLWCCEDEDQSEEGARTSLCAGCTDGPKELGSPYLLRVFSPESSCKFIVR